MLSFKIDSLESYTHENSPNVRVCVYLIDYISNLSDSKFPIAIRIAEKKRFTEIQNQVTITSQSIDPANDEPPLPNDGRNHLHNKRLKIKIQ